jgi:hypothetical protein
MHFDISVGPTPLYIHPSEQCLDSGLAIIHAKKCGCEECKRTLAKIAEHHSKKGIGRKQKAIKLAEDFANSDLIIKFRAVCEQWGQKQVEDAIYKGIVPPACPKALHQIRG